MRFSWDFVLDLTFLLGAIQSLLLGLIILFYKRQGIRNNIYLFLFLVIFAIILFGSTFQRHTYWWYGVFFDPLILLIGPSLYLYIKSFTQSITWRRIGKHLICLIFYLPLVCWFVYTVVEGIGTDATIEDMTLSSYSSHPILYSTALFKISQLIFYVYISFKAQTLHKATIERYYSETSKINLLWVKQLIAAFIFLVMITFISWSIQMAAPEYTLLIAGINLALITPVIYFAAFKGIQQPQILNGIIKDNHTENDPVISDRYQSGMNANKATDKYANAKLPESIAKRVAEKLISLMEKERLFLQNELSMQNLAEAIGYSNHIISQVLNDRIGKNFYEFVNEYRVQEAKELLESNSLNHFTLLAIGLRAGFNSKTSFNTIFKKYSGVTPSQYKKVVEVKEDREPVVIKS